MSKQPVEVYHLSHDLRGPLNSVLGFSELLLEGIEGPLTEPQREDIAAIQQSAQKLLHLINTIVDLSKLEADRLSFAMGAVNIGQMVEMIPQARFGADKPDDLSIVTVVPQNLPMFMGDSNRIEQILLSFVRFSFKHKHTREISITATATDSQLTVQVTLEGVVLPEEKREHLFELVAIVDESGRSELGPGGLELPLARQLAEQHGGKVWATSGDAELHFFLQLPIEEVA